MKMKSTRGERNNNPGNLREDPGDKTKWIGERATDDDPIFEEFETAHYGIRALAKVLLNYQRQRRLRTIDEMIARWAPPKENNTAAYARFVARKAGVAADTPVSLRDLGLLQRLVTAIIWFENGRCIYSEDQIKAACLAANT